MAGKWYQTAKLQYEIMAKRSLATQQHIFCLGTGEDPMLKWLTTGLPKLKVIADYHELEYLFSQRKWLDLGSYLSEVTPFLLNDL